VLLKFTAVQVLLLDNTAQKSLKLKNK